MKRKVENNASAPNKTGKILSIGLTLTGIDSKLKDDFSKIHIPYENVMCLMNCSITKVKNTFKKAADAPFSREDIVQFRNQLLEVSDEAVEKTTAFTPVLIQCADLLKKYKNSQYRFGSSDALNSARKFLFKKRMQFLELAHHVKKLPASKKKFLAAYAQALSSMGSVNSVAIPSRPSDFYLGLSFQPQDVFPKQDGFLVIYVPSLDRWMSGIVEKNETISILSTPCPVNLRKIEGVQPQQLIFLSLDGCRGLKGGEVSKDPRKELLKKHPALGAYNPQWFEDSPASQSNPPAVAPRFDPPKQNQALHMHKVVVSIPNCPSKVLHLPNLYNGVSLEYVDYEVFKHSASRSCPWLFEALNQIEAKSDLQVYYINGESEELLSSCMFSINNLPDRLKLIVKKEVQPDWKTAFGIDSLEPQPALQNGLQQGPFTNGSLDASLNRAKVVEESVPQDSVSDIIAASGVSMPMEISYNKLCNGESSDMWNNTEKSDIRHYNGPILLKGRFWSDLCMWQVLVLVVTALVRYECNLPLSTLHGEKSEFGLKAIASNGTSLRVKCFKYFKCFKREHIISFAKQCNDLEKKISDFKALADVIRATI